MFANLTINASDVSEWPWSNFAPYYQELLERPIALDNISTWLADWTHVSGLLYETYQRLYVAITVDTTDEKAKLRYSRYLDDIQPNALAADQQLKKKLLASGLNPSDFEIPLRNMRMEAGLFREANLLLLSEELKLSSEYDEMIGAQTVLWDGQEVTLMQLHNVYLETDRKRRETAWRMAARRQLEDRQAINALWKKLVELRCQLAANADLPTYRDYRWQQMLRFDYSPEDCFLFHKAIEEVAVPASSRIYEKRRARLGLDSLKPWDLFVDSGGRPALRPFNQIDQLIATTAAIFNRIDPQLSLYFEIMRSENLLDLENRKGKAPGGYCTDYPIAARPFIFMNAIGIHEDALTLLHEGGHAFHVFESNALPYLQQKQVGLEFAEVASMSMELVASPFLTIDQGGYYSNEDAARARIEHLESAITFWPYMAVVDAFQHWVYQNPLAGGDPASCDQKWLELCERFMPGIDWIGLEDELMTGWQRKLHIHTVPFYYIEYGLAQLGAFQVWRNSQADLPAAIAAYRRALALGGTVPLPQLFAAAGAKFAFDNQALQAAVSLAEKTIADLEEILS